MKKLMVKGAFGGSQIYVGETIDNLNNYIDPRRSAIITDTEVWRHHGSRFPKCPIISIGLGEKIKTLDTVADIYRQLVDLEADRSTFILGIGGGIVCDIAGFVASTFMRGTRFGFVSTTLLAQVDASVGGKNGVNFGGYKNMVGVFNQPEFVLCDQTLLNTLPMREILCGFAEIVKHGAIHDESMLSRLEIQRDVALALDPAIISDVVYRSIEIKAGVVARDEREQGERRKLNFGHTFGHALEKLTGMPHGEAVAIGMVIAAKLSVQKGWLADADVDRLDRILQSYGLPVRPPVDAASMLAALRKDKKREGRRIHFVFLESLGKAVVEELDLDDLHDLAMAAGIV